MKKLALALVCLVSVAFFASCNEPVANPEPSIAIMTGENYISDGQTIDLYKDYNLGFRVASNSKTQKELASFSLVTKVYNGTTEDVRPEIVEDTTITITGTEFVYEELVRWELAKSGVVGKVEYVATVFDKDNNMNTTTVTVNLNQAEDLLPEADFEWFRQGNEQRGLEEYGLYWERNAKSPFAEIKPLPGVVLYKFADSNVWNEVLFLSQKEAVFSDGAVTASMYNNVDVNQNGTYNDVIGTRMADGKLHLIRVEMCRIGAYTSQGTPITIFGKAK
jgi:hypothetical protein